MATSLTNHIVYWQIKLSHFSCMYIVLSKSPAGNPATVPDQDQDQVQDREREREREGRSTGTGREEKERQREVEKQRDGARERVSCREADRTGTVTATGIEIAANQTSQPAQGNHASPASQAS